MLHDLRIIARGGAYAVVDDSQLVAWPSGSDIELHHVQHHGCDDPLLRAIVSDREVLLVDLQRIHPALAAELRWAHERDRDGTVLYMLRQRFSGAAEFERTARAMARTAWSRQPEAVAA